MNNQTSLPGLRAVEQKRADIIARRAERKLYDREKTIALATGVICALIFLGGTALGSYHAFVMIGPFAGVLATASYLIADAVIIWAAVVDYHEDKNAMEWAAWAVKYGLSLYMLFAGGCIAYKLFNLSEAETAITLRTSAATKAYNDCVAAARTRQQRAACRQFAGDVQTSEAMAHASRTNAARPAWMDRFTNHPLFNYLPGILAVLGAALLTLLSKLFPQRLDDDLVEAAPRTQPTAPRPQPGFAPAQARASIPKPRPYVRPEDKQARVTTEPTAAELRAPAEDKLAAELARLGAVKQEDLEPVEPATATATTDDDVENSPPAGARSHKGMGARSQTPERAATGTGREPRAKGKPPTVGGGYWRPNSGGWDFVISVRNPDGSRSRPSLGHLSKSALEDLKRQHKGKALADALARWVAERERENCE